MASAAPQGQSLRSLDTITFAPLAKRELRLISLPETARKARCLYMPKELCMTDNENTRTGGALSATPEDPAGQEVGTSAPASFEEGTPVIPSTLPVLAVRDVVVFNYMILPLFVGREKSVLAVESAIQNNRYLFVCAQKEEQVEDPAPDDLYATGSIVAVMRMLKMPDGRLKLLVQGISRARITSFVQMDPFMLAEVQAIEEHDSAAFSVEVEAMLRSAREQSEKILSLRGVSAGEIMTVLHSVDDPGRLADLIAANLRMRVDEAQRILEAEEPVARLQLVNTQLSKEVEVATMQARIQSSAREGMDKAQKDYFLREQMKAIRRELGERDFDQEDEVSELAGAIAKAGMPKEVRKEAEKQLQWCAPIWTG